MDQFNHRNAYFGVKLSYETRQHRKKAISMGQISTLRSLCWACLGPRRAVLRCCGTLRCSGCRHSRTVAEVTKYREHDHCRQEGPAARNPVCCPGAAELLGVGPQRRDLPSRATPRHPRRVLVPCTSPARRPTHRDRNVDVEQRSDGEYHQDLRRRASPHPSAFRRDPVREGLPSGRGRARASVLLRRLITVDGLPRRDDAEWTRTPCLTPRVFFQK